MGAILHGALIGFEWWCGLSALGAVAYCIVGARHNARVRATRRQMRADLMDDLIERADFDLWAIELGAPLPTIDFEEWDK